MTIWSATAEFMWEKSSVVTSILRRPTLVLNRSWQPIAVAPVYRALTKVFVGSARVVDPSDYQLYTWADWADLEPEDGEPVIHSQRLAMRVPEVISLVDFDQLPQVTVSLNRRNLFSRDRHTCQYCGAQPGSEELTIDHVVPRSHGGESSWENCVLACVGCNHRKADRTPEIAHMHLRRQPERPMWKPLFEARSAPVESWSRFISEAYWNVALRR